MRLKNLELDEKHTKIINSNFGDAKNSKLNILISGDSLSKRILNFILFIPIFIEIDSNVRNLQLFKRHHNTILHMKDASNYHTFNRRNF